MHVALRLFGIDVSLYYLAGTAINDKKFLHVHKKAYSSHSFALS